MEKQGKAVDVAERKEDCMARRDYDNVMSWTTNENIAENLRTECFKWNGRRTLNVMLRRLRRICGSRIIWRSSYGEILQGTFH